jgi:3-oxosteroid 1-dehydrogenase
MPPDASGSSDVEVDVLVVGSGAGGLTAALVAAASGNRVLVIEKAAMWGGTSATSGGMIWIAASHLAESQGARDSPAECFAYLRAITDREVSDAALRAYVERGREMLAWLHENTQVRFRSIPYTDYRPTVPGAKLGFRTHDPVPMDGRLIGEHLATLRPSAPAALLFNRIAFTMDDVHPLLHRPPGWWRVLAKLVVRYYGDVPQRLRSPRNRFLAAGNALLGRLRLSLEAYRVPVWLAAPMLELTREPATQRIDGVIADRAGQAVRIRARRAVILASGGFEASAALRQRYLPHAPDPAVTGAVESNCGDGLLAGERQGAALRAMDSAWWGPMLRFPDESRARLLTFERALPGGIIVNRAGRRYMNEAAAYDVAASRMLAADRPDAGTSPSYFVFDNRYRRRYPLGPLLPRIPIALHQRGLRETLVAAHDWPSLAALTGLPAEGLQETIRRFNENAALGRDPDFGRGDSDYDRFYGDPKVLPNPTLAPLAEPPYFALPVYAGDIGTNGGLLTDERGRVLDKRQRPLEGLYAVGNVAASVMGHAYPGAGGTLGPAMTFGYIAARHACATAETVG